MWDFWPETGYCIVHMYIYFCFHQLTLIVTGAIFTVSIMRPYIFIAAIPLAIIFVILRKYFLRTGQQLKLLEAEGEGAEKGEQPIWSIKFVLSDNWRTSVQINESLVRDLSETQYRLERKRASGAEATVIITRQTEMAMAGGQRGQRGKDHHKEQKHDRGRVDRGWMVATKGWNLLTEVRPAE